ncbi:MFS transporter [uncultured Aeromicrobium sp.]|uniref:MFS transporter n=1 Tax=uncultured Aeromicrobium sp. TaxID=337820 RepID=UPI0025E52527|nr:MFS transporter [uncultured Aeromicrobium sp.]
MSEATTDTASTSKSDPRLPFGALLALALAGFVCIMTETMPAGLLPQIADGLDVSESAAGQWVSLYAAGTVIAALPAIALTRGMRRKPLLIIGASGFLVANLATALTPTYEFALVARAVAGAFSGLLWGMLAGYARRLVPPHQSGRAMAVAMVGTPVALSIGTPLGTLLGTALGWRWAFVVMSLAAGVLIVWAVLGVPDRPGQNDEDRTPVFRVMWLPGVAPILITALVWMLGHNLLYTYIAPYISWVGVGARVDLALLVFGLSSLVSIWITGVLVDRMLRVLVLTATAAFAVTGVALMAGGGIPVVFWASVVLWGLTFGGAATQLQTALADAAGPDGDVAQAMMTVTWNLAIFGGGALGGAILASVTAGALPPVVTALASAAFVIVLVARRHAFRLGARQAGVAAVQP